MWPESKDEAHTQRTLEDEGDGEEEDVAGELEEDLGAFFRVLSAISIRLSATVHVGRIHAAHLYRTTKGATEKTTEQPRTNLT